MLKPTDSILKRLTQKHGIVWSHRKWYPCVWKRWVHVRQIDICLPSSVEIHPSGHIDRIGNTSIHLPSFHAFGRGRFDRSFQYYRVPLRLQQHIWRHGCWKWCSRVYVWRRGSNKRLFWLNLNSMEAFQPRVVQWESNFALLRGYLPHPRPPSSPQPSVDASLLTFRDWRRLEACAFGTAAQLWFRWESWRHASIVDYCYWILRWWVPGANRRGEIDIHRWRKHRSSLRMPEIGSASHHTNLTLAEHRCRFHLSSEKTGIRIVEKKTDIVAEFEFIKFGFFRVFAFRPETKPKFEQKNKQLTWNSFLLLFELCRFWGRPRPRFLRGTFETSPSRLICEGSFFVAAIFPISGAASSCGGPSTSLSSDSSETSPELNLSKFGGGKSDSWLVWKTEEN